MFAFTRIEYNEGLEPYAPTGYYTVNYDARGYVTDTRGPFISARAAIFFGDSRKLWFQVEDISMDYRRHIEYLPRFFPYVAGYKVRNPEFGAANGLNFWIVFSFKTGAIVWRGIPWKASPQAVAERLNQ